VPFDGPRVRYMSCSFPAGKAIEEKLLVEANDHRARVDAWMGLVAKDAAPKQLLEIFEQGFGAMWRRAHATLGDVTLMAILDRVLYNAAERFPLLATLEMHESGLRADTLREGIDGLNRDHLQDGLRFILVEFLTVLGNLTAEVLTPALHSALAKAAVPGEEAKS
jgi:hypothetical protein